MTVRIVTGANGIKYITNEPFKPNYNTEVVLVEEMQRMAKRILELEALAQPKQEPLAWISTGKARMIHWTADKPTYGDDWVPLYTTPPQRKPLTDEEIWKFWWSRPEVPEGEDDSMEEEFVAAVRAVLAAHGIKE